MEKLKKHKIGILGIGSIGGSIAKDLALANNDLFAIGRFEDSNLAYSQKIVSRVVDLKEAVNNLNIIIISSPIDTIITYAEKISKLSKKRANDKGKLFVIDVGSVKTDITEAFNKLCDERVEYLSSHPMSGSEFKGFINSQPKLFENKPWVLCIHNKNTDEGVELVNEIINVCSAIKLEMNAEEHDEKASLVSHLLSVLSCMLFEFIEGKNNNALNMAGTGLEGMTRLASGNPEMHSAIASLNHDNIKTHLHEFILFLNAVNIDRFDIKYFTKIKKHRDQWIQKRSLHNAHSSIDKTKQQL